MNDTHSEALAFVEQQLTQIEQLEQLLHQETEILKNNNAKELTEITQQKQTLLENIHHLDQTLSTSEMFKAAKQAGVLEEHLAKIQQCLEQCQHINQVNGHIITQSQVAVERLKSTLLDNRGKASMTYDSKGKKHVGLSSLGIKA